MNGSRPNRLVAWRSHRFLHRLRWSVRPWPVSRRNGLFILNRHKACLCTTREPLHQHLLNLIIPPQFHPPSTVPPFPAMEATRGNSPTLSISTLIIPLIRMAGTEAHAYSTSYMPTRPHQERSTSHRDPSTSMSVGDFASQSRALESTGRSVASPPPHRSPTIPQGATNDSRPSYGGNPCRIHPCRASRTGTS